MSEYQKWLKGKRNFLNLSGLDDLSESNQDFINLDMRKLGFGKYAFNEYRYFLKYGKKCPKNLKKFLA